MIVYILDDFDKIFAVTTNKREAKRWMKTYPSLRVRICEGMLIGQPIPREQAFG